MNEENFAADSAESAILEELTGKVNDVLSTQLDGAFQPLNYTPGYNFQVRTGSNNNLNRNTLRKKINQLGIEVKK